MKLSIVTTLYNSSSYINEFYERCSICARKLTMDYELIFVNDGSPDDSLNVVKKIAYSDEKVVVIDLSRNFGHHKAMMTGLAQASGELIFLIDSDLEEKPEWLLEFNEKISSDDCDVVYGIQERRKGNWFEKLSGYFYYKLINVFFKHPKNITTARLMTKQYVSNLLLFREREVVISGLWILTGFDQRSVLVNKTSKKKSSYNLSRKLSHLFNTITSFTSKPLIGIFGVGLIISSVTFIYACLLIINRLFFSVTVEGWTSIMVSIWLLGGIIILFIGIVGVYISKLFSEVKHRPYTIVKEIINDKTK